mgnify:CR=1 FL=1
MATSPTAITVSLGGADGFRVNVDAHHCTGAEASGGQGQDAGAAAEIEHAVAWAQRLFQQRPVFRFLHRFQDQRRVRRRIMRLEYFHCMKIAGIGNDGGNAFQ